MSFSLIIVFTLMLFYCNVHAQRSPYAGARPASGYKDTYLPQSTSATSNNGGNTIIGNRDGEADTTLGGTTTQRLPYDAYNDAAIVNHYNSLPIDQRPFWILNQAHIEAHRGTPPLSQTGSTIQSNRPDLDNRFNDNMPQQPINSATNPNNVISLPEVVYPSNITPEQRLNMEIQFLQQRLEILLERRRQLQAQNGQPSGQTVPNLQGLPSPNFLKKNV